MPIYERKEVADALMHPEDRSVEYRGNILPLLRRAVTDPYDDISEYEQIEFAVPGMIRDPFLGMNTLGAMALGDIPFNPDEVTQTALDVGLLSTPLSLMGGVPRGAVLGVNVFHGGPHRFAPEPDFPHGRPRLDKIGTGEGAQAYGYGFYSAADPNVARTYQSKVSAMQGREEPTIHGKPVNWDDPVQTAAFELARHGGNRTAAADFHASVFQGGENNRAVKLLRSDQPLPDVALPGTLYKLDIPDADVAKYLDWDKPLSEQPKSVREALANMFSVSAADKKQITKEIKAVKARLNDPWVQRSGGTEMKNKLKEQLQELKAVLLDDSLTGEEFYAGAVAGLGGREAASEALREAGIPGLKYFDQGSRKPGASSLTTQQLDVRIDSLKKDIASGGGQQDVMKRKLASLQRERAKHEEANRTRNYVTWDQDVLNRSKMLERDGVTLGANKSPTAALPGLLDDTASRMQRARDMGFDTDTTYYHGTTHDFDQFGGATGNVGGHFGAGHYATDNPIDASRNYAGVGPDLTGRIESRAERIAQDVMDDRGVSEEVANRYGRIVATRELKGQHGGAVLPLVARGKTADITGDNQTFLEYNYGGDFNEHLKDARADLGAKASDDEVLDRAYEYQDDYMMSNEPTGELADFIQGLRNQEKYYLFDADEVIGKINERAIDGGMTAMELDDLLRKSDSVMYAETMDTGDLVGNEIIRNAFNEAGFENIVMDASVAFPHMKNIPMGTKHIITSNPANLRSRFAKFDPAKADSADLLAANPVTAAVPGLLSQQELKNSEDQADTINLLSQMLQNKTPIAQKRHWGAYLGEV